MAPCGSAEECERDADLAKHSMECFSLFVIERFFSFTQQTPSETSQQTLQELCLCSHTRQEALYAPERVMDLSG